MKKYLLSFFVMFQIVLLSMGVGVLSRGVMPIEVSATQAMTEETAALSLTAPNDLKELQAADSAQLDAWAKNLTSFDGRTYDIITSAKNQSDRPICWAYAAIGAAEASILREGIDDNANRTNLDLDEYVAAYMRYNRDGQHDPLNLTNNDTFSDTWLQGGHADEAFLMMSQGYGPIDQATNYYSKDDAIKALISESDYYVQGFKRIANNEQAIKRAILEYGAVAMEYKGGSYNYLYYDYETGRTCGHASIIVGWDDNISRTLFQPSKPTNNGAWIIKNSWGSTGFSKNGAYCQYLAYDSYLSSNLYVVDLAMKDDYQNIYYYDGQMSTSYTNYAATQAAIYEAKLSTATEQEQLTAVTIMTSLANLDADVKIYTGLQVNPGNVNDDCNNPVQGDPVSTVKKHLDRQGLHTIDLVTPVNLEQGEYFSIVVKVTDAYGDISPVVCSTENNASINDMTYYLDGDTWTSYKDSQFYADTSTKRMTARIRGITKMIPRSEDKGNDLQYARVEIPNRLVFYERGKELVPEFEVYFDDNLLIEKQDYTFTVRDNKTPGMATIQISGIKNYHGTRTTTFEVAKLRYPPNKMPSVVEVYDNVKKLHDIAIPEDWEWIDLEQDLESGMSSHAYSLKYIGKDADFYQILTCDFYVNKLQGDPPGQKDITKASVEVLGVYEYTGSLIEPIVKVIYQGFELKPGVDYEKRFENNKDAGQATVIVSGKGLYVGEIRQGFEIKKADWPIDKPNDKISISRRAKTLNDVPLNYNNWQWKSPSQTITGDSFTAIAEYVGQDKYNFNTTTILITLSWMELKDISTLYPSLEQTKLVYDGLFKTPNVIIMDGGYYLENGLDYNVIYADNKLAGRGSAFISGLNDYTGAVTLEFEIEKAEREGFVVSQQNWTFGDEETPLPSVTEQIEGGNITYLYSKTENGVFTETKPTNAGKYWIMAKMEASANYKESVTKSPFEILPKDLSNFEFTLSDAELHYTGRQIRPMVYAKDGQTQLKEYVDFAVTYENNIVSGKNAIANIQGINNYTGRTSVTFEILKAEKVEVKNSTIKVEKEVKHLADLTPPTNFEWIEGSLKSVDENRMTVRARYIGNDASNYKSTIVEFEIIIERVSHVGETKFVYITLAVVFVIVAAGATAFVMVRRKRKKIWKDNGEM